MKVQDVMSMSASTCFPNEPLHSVAKKLWDHDCGCLPVVDDDARVVAMITDRDVCMAAFTTGRPLAELRVAGSMSKVLVTCHPHEDLVVATSRMAKNFVRRLPVVDAEGRLVGVLSVNDLVTAIAEGPAPKLSNVAAAETLRVLQAVCHHRAELPVSTAEPALATAAAAQAVTLPRPVQQPKPAVV